MHLVATHKSQYLLQAYLTGSNDSNLTGNDQDNRFSGNIGNNVIDGREGVDTLINMEHLVFDGESLNELRFGLPVPPNLPRDEF